MKNCAATTTVMIALIASGSVAVAPAFGQVRQDYRCKIERVVTPDPVPNTALAFLEKTHLGKEFTVERRTGLMAGALKNSYVTKPEVIDLGSDQNSYKVVTTMRIEQGAGYGSNIYVLVIDEFARTPTKPFVFTENDEVYLGTCTHF